MAVARIRAYLGKSFCTARMTRCQISPRVRDHSVASPTVESQVLPYLGRLTRCKVGLQRCKVDAHLQRVQLVPHRVLHLRMVAVRGQVMCKAIWPTGCGP